MSLTYKKANEGKIETPSFLFLAHPGGGKTTLCGQAATHLCKVRGGRFLIINCDANEDRRKVKAVIESPAEILDCPKWVDILRVMTDEYKQFTAGIAIDNLMGYARECMFDVLGMPNVERLNLGQQYTAKFNQSVWFQWGERLKNHVQTIIGRGIPIIVTSHVRFDKDELSGVIYKGVNLWGSPALEVPAMFTVSGVCSYKGNEKWQVAFRPEDNYPARDATGRLDPKEPLDFAHIWNKVMGVPVGDTTVTNK